MKSNTLQGNANTISKTAIIKSVFIAALSFFLPLAKIFAVISPFSVALVAAVPYKYTLVSTIGSLFGYYAFYGYSKGLYNITAVLIVFLVKLLLHKFISDKTYPIILSILAFSAFTVTTIINISFNTIPTLDVIFMFAQAILAGSFCFFYVIAFSALLSPDNKGIYSPIELSTITILFITVVMTLASIPVFKLNLGVIIGVAVILIFISKYSLLGGSIISIVVAIALNLYDIHMTQFTAILIGTTFLSAIFKKLTMFTRICILIISSSVCVFSLGFPLFLTYRLMDIFLGCAVFILIPSRLTSILDATSNKFEKTNSDAFLNTNIATRLGFASNTIKDLQRDLMTVSNQFEKINNSNIFTIYDTIAEQLCKNCSLALNCWETNYSTTIDNFAIVNQILKSNGKIDIKQMPQYFSRKCSSINELCESINAQYKSFNVALNSNRRVSESRRIIIEQFNGIADMLCELSTEFTSTTTYSELAVLKAKKAFTKLLCEPDNIICTLDKYGRMYVEIYLASCPSVSPTVICKTLSNALDKDFDLPSISNVAEQTKISLFEKATYTIDFAVQQSCYNDNTVCGDSFSDFCDSKGFFYLVLSDGMGCGKRAAVDSVMTCSIIVKLIKAGFGLESALKLINSSLIVKSSDESLATIDIAKIDLYSGVVEFLKAGAATSFFSCKSSVGKVCSTSLPVGIVDGIEFDKKIISIKKGDTIVMVSDGVTANGDKWVINEMKNGLDLSAKALSIKLCNEAKKRSDIEHSDDITVMVAKLH